MIPPLLRRLALALLLCLALVAGASAGSFEVATYADLCKVGTGADGWTLDADYIQTADIQSPSHTYSTAGTYPVALTVTNPGGSDTETKTGYITVSAPPPTAPPTAANSPAFPYSQQRKETLSFLLMCWGALAFVGVFCVVIFLLMNGAQRGSGGI